MAKGQTKRSRCLKFFLTLILLALLLAAAAGFLIYAPFGPSTETFVDILPGTSSHAIAARLQSAGVIRNQYAIAILRILKGGTLKAGEYRFDHPAPATEVYARIVRGDVYTVALTIPEGYNIFDI